MLKHYLDLFCQFRMVILAGVVGTSALACGLSLWLLQSMPIFKSNVVLNMQPSEEALTFNRAFMGMTQFNPAVIITQTHIERILSRQVAERALDILLAESGGQLPVEPPTAFDWLKAAIWENWNKLNYGYFIPASPRDQMVNDLMGAIGVEMVEGSYILNIEVSYTNGEIAARAANAVARAFIETASLDFAEDARSLDASLEILQAQKNAILSKQIQTRLSLQRLLASESVDDSRVLLSAARITADQERVASQRVLERLQADLQQADASDTATLSELRAEVVAAEDAVAQRTLAVERTTAAMRSLEASETALEKIELQITETENDLEQLRSRRLSTALAREARMNQVGIISAAQVPIYPTFPKVLVNTVVGAIMGGILFLAPIAVLDVLNNRIRTSEDLRLVAGEQALPTVSRRLAAQARKYLQKGKAPRRDLKEFAEVMSRRFLTEGHKRWPYGKIYVTAFGTTDHVAQLHVVVKAAANLMGPGLSDDAVPEVVALPAVARLGSWADCKGGTIMIGVACGRVEASEVESIRGAELAPGSASFFAVVL